jgi:hypothetical protein
MNSLPPELDSLIIELACESSFGVYTTRAISRTSTYFHDIAAPFRFHTLAVSTQKQAAHLIPLLETIPAHKRHIRRLFLGPDLGLAPASLLRLLHLAAPTLRDLALVLTQSTSTALLGAVFRARLPHLKALAVRGFYPLPPPGAFPALTHLHLAGNRAPAGVPTALARACPGLTHLRVSGLSCAPVFARELRDAVEDAEHLVLPHLERIALEVQPAWSLTKNKAAELRDTQMRDIFVALEKRKDKGVPRVEFSEENGDEVDADKLKIGWLGMTCP